MYSFNSLVVILLVVLVHSTSAYIGQPDRFGAIYSTRQRQDSGDTVTEVQPTSTIDQVTSAATGDGEVAPEIPGIDGETGQEVTIQTGLPCQGVWAEIVNGRGGQVGVPMQIVWGGLPEQGAGWAGQGWGQGWSQGLRSGWSQLPSGWGGWPMHGGWQAGGYPMNTFTALFNQAGYDSRFHGGF